jgi:ADP-ribosyl-[dinitrogen reductase] hydrolase
MPCRRSLEFSITLPVRSAPIQANSKPPPLRNSYWVLPGRVLAGEHPGAATREATRERVQRLIAAGVECFIDLTQPNELERYDIDLPFNVEYLRKPIKDHGIPAQREHMLEILDCLHDALRSGRCVYVHCRAGIGRTGTVIGCLLTERGLTGEEALDELNALWQQCERSQSWMSVPETDEQTNYVRQWKARPQFAQELRSAPGPATAGGSAKAGGTAKGPAEDGAATVARLEAAAQPDGRARVGAISAEGSAAAGKAAAGEAVPGVAASGIRVAGQPATDTPPPAIATRDSLLEEADPLLDPAILSAARTLRERFLGALLGLAAGDAVAAATQYRRPGTFAPVGDLLGGGPFDLPRGGWSDDTSMALCLAESLLERDGFDARDQMERYRRWQQEGYLSATGQCVGITASTARAIAMAQWRRQAFSGSHDPTQLDPEPLSRVAPAVLFFFASGGQAIEQATQAARTTCQAPAVLDSCRSLARALYGALSGQPKAVIMESAPVAVGSAPTAGADTGARGTGTAPDALAAAFTAFGATDNFRDAILYAANLGGDSDVVASACGQLAGAFYSVKAIPPVWHNSLMHKELITSYADRLLAHALLGLSG